MVEWKAKNHQLKQLLANFLLCFECKCNELCFCPRFFGQRRQISHLFLKLPFINEEFKRRALGVLNPSRIQNVKIHFINGQPLSKVFAPPKVKQNCTEGSETCKISSKPNRCLKKNVVYNIICSARGTVSGKRDEQ